MCLFCEIYNDSNIEPFYVENRILDESDFFYLKSALGQFVDGYSLIISKEHYKSFSRIPIEQFQDLKQFIATVKDNIEKITKRKTIVFEHGILDNCYSGGSCLEHAHLHIVPLDFDIYNELAQNFPNAEISEIDELPEYFKKSDSAYVYYENQDSKKYYFQVGDQIQSQYVRRIIGNKLGLLYEWDWRYFPYRNRIDEFNKEYEYYCALVTK